MTYRYIYKITCTAGSFKDKFYFGQHTSSKPSDRYKGSGKLIKDYYKSYPNDYIKEIISYHNSQEELNQAEYDIIKDWLGNPMCLNICEGGIGSGFRHHAEETKQKMKGRIPWNKGKKIPEWLVKLNSEVHKGIIPSEETRKKMSLSRIGKKFTDEHKRNLSNSLKGHVISEETRKKISESHKKVMLKEFG
jgi:hypothetical protein